MQISISPADEEKKSDHCLDGYPFAIDNGFIQGKGKTGVIEVLEIEKQLFHRYIPTPPPHSSTVMEYTQPDIDNFPCYAYEDRVLLQGALEESRILEQRLQSFRNTACSLKSIIAQIETIQSQIKENTAKGDFPSCFQLQEQINGKQKEVLTLIPLLINNTECNTILCNTLDYKMKAAAEISEYEQAQRLKETLENYNTLTKELQQSGDRLGLQRCIDLSNTLSFALQYCNYLTD